jgi:CheY-like chemotaxis protein
MKPILIHNNNSFLASHYSKSFNTLKFSVNNNVDIDYQITDWINNNSSRLCGTAIFIKACLSINYLEYLGLRLAMHLRLSVFHPQLQQIPIVILCAESFEELSKTSQFPELLNSEGLFISSENPKNIDKLLLLNEKCQLNGCSALNKFTNLINISPPDNYQSHHSIVNEWSILRWAMILQITDNDTTIINIKKNVDGLLYYKYLKSKYPITNGLDCVDFKVSGKGKVLFIDDDCAKGWEAILKKITSFSLDIELEAFGFSLKDKSQKDIISDCKNKVQDSRPNVVILDLRLSRSDYSHELTARELTGYKVLREIKKLNPGIQVIIFTASNKVWNFLELQAAGANGFVLKESPENSVNSRYSFDAIKSFCRQISVCLSNSYLIAIWECIHKIKLSFDCNILPKINFNLCDHDQSQKLSLYDKIDSLELKNLIKNELDAFFEILNIDNINKYHLAMLMQFKMLEYLNAIFISTQRNKTPFFYDGSIFEYYNTESKIIKSRPIDDNVKIYKQCSEINKILNIANKKCKINDNDVFQSLISLSKIRNKYAHTKKDNEFKPNINSSDILNWMHSITSVLSEI